MSDPDGVSAIIHLTDGRSYRRYVRRVRTDIVLHGGDVLDRTGKVIADWSEIVIVHGDWHAATEDLRGSIEAEWAVWSGPGGQDDLRRTVDRVCGL